MKIRPSFLERKSSPTAKVLSLLNQKGGVGKTTFTFNLAYALKERGRKVLCLDLDPQANLTLLFKGSEVTYENPYHIFHLLLNTVKELKVLHQPVLVNDLIGNRLDVDYLPSGSELSGLDLTLGQVSFPRQLVLRRFLEKSGLLGQYDYILIDAPPTLGLLVINILCACQGILVPFRPDQFSRNGISQLYQVLQDVEEMELVPVPKILGHIPNLVEGRRKQDETDLTLIRQDLLEASGEGSGEGRFGPAKIFPAFGNRVLLTKSNGQQKSVFEYTTKEFKEIQEQFLEIGQYVEEQL